MGRRKPNLTAKFDQMFASARDHWATLDDGQRHMVGLRVGMMLQTAGFDDDANGAFIATLAGIGLHHVDEKALPPEESDDT